MSTARAERERKAYDEDGVWERCNAVHGRFRHVFHCPNTRRAQLLLDRLFEARVPGKRVLELGCGNGAQASRLCALGAAHVLGLEVSESFLAQARAHEVPGRLEFRLQDITAPIAGTFDLIYGASILHHIDFRPVLERLHRDNLEPGGAMVFREPLGSNLLMRLWWALGRKAHTPDERPLSRADLAWLAREFPGFQLTGVNYLSFPAGVITSLVCKSADNALLRWTDRVDAWLHDRIPRLRYRFRHSVIVIEKLTGP